MLRTRVSGVIQAKKCRSYWVYAIRFFSYSTTKGCKQHVYRFVQLVVCGQCSGLVPQGLEVITVGVAPSSPQAIFVKEGHAEKAALRTAED